MNCPPRSVLITGFLSLLLLATCAPGPMPRPHPWADALRALDPADASNPAHDLTAVYLRQTDDDLQIRVDLLDFQGPGQLSLEIMIGDESAPEAPPLSIHIPAESDSARVDLDPQLDTVIVTLPLSNIPARSRVDVFTPEDGITRLKLDGPVPNQTAPLLLTFYDTFAGRFPAEALRSWDGAHTGPRGERHGLKHLLDAVEEYQIPVVLLDLKEPENLSALDAMGVLPRIRQLSDEDLLILPDQPVQGTLFGLPTSPFSWGGELSRPTFAPSSDPSHLYQPFFSKTTFIPISSGTEATQPTRNGPSLEVRRALLETALTADEKDILVLGGDLPNSTWGSPDMVGTNLAYFASRPYIHVLSADDLMVFPTKLGKPEVLPSQLDGSTSNLEAHYQILTKPVLEFAGNWDGSPLNTCVHDIDKDGQPECILANESYLAILDPQGARLTYLFAVGRIDNSRNLHQLIGPSWQVAMGLSNPSLWDLSAGEAADPGAYPGAFADADDPFKPYKPAIEGNTLTFTSLDGTRTKTFRLTETSLEVEYQTREPVTAQIPLLVEPDTRFTLGWAENYVQEKTPSGIAWGLENGQMVRIHIVSPGETDGPVTMRAFNESLSFLQGPEDPDFDYPPGHYIPFPMAIAEVEMDSGYFLRLERLP